MRYGRWKACLSIFVSGRTRSTTRWNTRPLGRAPVKRSWPEWNKAVFVPIALSRTMTTSCCSHCRRRARERRKSSRAAALRTADFTIGPTPFEILPLNSRRSRFVTIHGMPALHTPMCGIDGCNVIPSTLWFFRGARKGSLWSLPLSCDDGIPFIPKTSRPRPKR